MSYKQEKCEDVGDFEKNKLEKNTSSCAVLPVCSGYIPTSGLSKENQGGERWSCASHLVSCRAV